MKKILAAIAACAMSAAMLGMTVCAAGAEGDEAELDDGTEVSDEGDISLEDEGDEDEAPADDEEPADEEEAAPAPVQNPGTGNSPIALAVIPVALAAAAVVAKKAK